MGLLGSSAALIDIRFGRKKGFSKAILNPAPDLLNRFRRDSGGVGPHIGDQTHRPDFTEVNPSYNFWAIRIVFWAEKESFR